MKIIPIFFILLFPALLPARPLIIADGEGGQFDLSPSLYFLEDPTGQLTMPMVHELQLEKRFVLNRAKHPSFGLTHSAIWAKFTLQSISEKQERWYLLFESPALQHIDLFLPGADGKYRHKTSGYFVDFKERAVQDRKITFELEPSRTPQTIYFRVASGTPIELPASVISSSALLQKLKGDAAYYGMFAGLIAGIIVYNLFIFVMIRDKSYFYYILYVLFNFFALATLQGYAKVFFLHDNNDLAMLIENLCGASASVFAIQFARHFLNTKINAPLQDRILSVLALVFIFNFLVGNTFFGETGRDIYEATFFMILPVGALLLLFTGIYFYREYNFARYYTHAWIFYLLLIVLYSLHIFNIYTIDFLSHYALEIGSATEAMLLSFALASRIRTLQDEVMRDSLTGLFNRRGIQKILINEMNRNREKSQTGTLSLIIIDIDDFKFINDTYGHAAGDVVLKEFSDLLIQNIRSSDFLARWGGEEFVIVACETTSEESRMMAEKLKTLVEHHTYFFSKTITASFGIAEHAPPETARDFFHRADMALYRAKTEGKNKIVQL